jgi:hypothetical protein
MPSPFSLPGSFVLASALVLLAQDPLPSPPSAPWTVKTGKIVEKTPDGAVDLDLDLPVLEGKALPAARDRINQALRAASGAGQRLREAREARRGHEAFLQKGAAAGARSDDSYACRSTFEVGRLDRDWVSVRFEAGGHRHGMAAGFTRWTACTCSARTGRGLALADLFGPDWRARLAPLLQDGLAHQDQDTFDPDWRAKVARIEPGFWLKPEAMVFFYQRYEIAAGVRGVVTVVVPMAQIQPLMLFR